MSNSKFFGLSYLPFCSAQIAEKIDSLSNDFFLKQTSLHTFFSTGRKYQRASFRSHKKYDSEAYDFLFALDLTVRCCDATLALCVEAMFADEVAETPVQKQIASITSLASYIHQVGKSAEELIWRGEDLAARILARSIAEASDYSIVFQHDIELATKYANSSGDFRPIWYSYLRSEKSQKARNKALKVLFSDDDEAVSQLHEFRKSEMTVVSQAVHPSYDAGVQQFFWMATTPDEESEWAFLNRWPHSRVSALLIDCIGLQMSTLLIHCTSPSSEWLTIPRAPESYFEFDDASITAILTFTMLASSFVAHSHQLYPVPDANDSE